MPKSVRVSDYMASKLVTFTPEMNIFSAVDKLLDHDIAGAPVVDHHGDLVGIISQTDCLQNVLKGSFYDDSSDTVAHYMQTEVDAVRVDDDIVSVAQKLIRNHRRRFPVLNDAGRLVGMITSSDVLRVIRDFAEHR